MIKRSAKIFVVGLLLASIAGAVNHRRAFSAEIELPLKEELKQDAQVKEISGYRQWARITPKPQRVISPTEMG